MRQGSAHLSDDFFTFEDNGVHFILYLRNFWQKIIQPIHIPLPMCIHLFCARAEAIGWFLQMVTLWWFSKSENENVS